jgi:GNAT superfamily N-acetyltransferase
MEIRQMELWDMGQVARLCEQFGYPARNEQIEERFKQISHSSDHQLFVADIHGDIGGWVHVHGILSLGSDPYAEIRGIVVAQNYRQQGVGRRLLLQTETWALENGYRIVRLRSGTERPEAHHFYPKVGYEHIKSQYLYQKVLVEGE